MIRLRSLRAALLCTGAALLVAAPARAQRSDVVHGRVVGPDTMPIAGATIVVIDSANRTAPPHQTRADAKGAFSVTVESGSGTYVVAVNFLGYAAQRRTVKRGTDGAIPEMVFKMSQVAAQLGAVRTVGERPKTGRSETNGDQSVGGQTSFLSLSNGLSGDVTGDLSAALTMIPGVTVTPSATGGIPSVSAFGVSGDQNSVILNGLGFGGSVPRDGIAVSAVTSTYDPGKGGFAGLQQSVRLSPGNNFLNRTIHASYDAPELQYTTPVASQLATKYGQQILSGFMSGPVVLDHVFYSTSYQFQRRTNALPSLANIDPASLLALRTSPDSVSRLVNSLGAMGIPLTVSGVPNAREGTGAVVSTRIDWIPHPVGPTQNLPPGFIFFGGPGSTADTYYFQAGGAIRNNSGGGIGATSAPAIGSESYHRDGWAQLTAAKYLPQSILNETTVGMSGSLDRTSPYLDLPSARILVTSTLPGGDVGLSTLSVGGNSGVRSESQNWSAELRNQTSWNTWDKRHSVQLTLDGTVDGYAVDQDPSFGTFAYNSLSDFENGIPASFSRTLTGVSRSGRGLTGAIGLGDVWTPKLPSPTLGQTGPVFQYGLRLDANHLDITPAFNPAVDEVFGLNTSHVPSTLAVTPMVGFRVPLPWQYKSDLGFFNGSRLQLSGGVREYRGAFATRNVDSYARQTGLPSAVQQLFCVGDASPTPNWHGFDASSSAIPTDCANGTSGSALAQTTPPVALLAPDYRLQESWRPELSLFGRITDMFSGTVRANLALNQNLANFGTYDVNFNAQPQFTLANEGGRPVYVLPTSIVPQTGTAAWTDSRVSPLFAHVAETRTDLRNETKTLAGTLNYFPFFLGRTTWTYNASLTYTYSDSREEFRGFTGGTDGDPREVGWSRSGFQAKHAFALNASLRRDRIGFVSLFARVQSGLPFTPSVSGDINGDGYNDDRAFIFNPALTPDTSIANPISRLLAGAPSNTRSCLQRQLGTVAGRLSCVGSWTMPSLNLTINPDPYRIGLGNRGQVSLIVSNVLSGLDQALHGSSHLHGWGSLGIPDQTLLTVRGFDPVKQQFIYTVNPAFGSTTTFRNTFRQPFQLTLDFRMDVGPDRESQQLGSLLRPTKTDKGPILTEQVIKQRIARANNPLDQILLVKDSLKLTDAQIDSMRKVSLKYMTTRDSIAGVMAKFLASRNGDYTGEDVRERWHREGVATYTVFFRAYHDILAIFTPEQVERSKSVPQTQGLFLQLNSLKASDIPQLFRGPMSQLP